MEPVLSARLANLGERLDSHRKRQRVEHPDLTITQMYNVLEKLKAGEILDTSEQQIYNKGLVRILLDIHNEIDAAVFEAYGWPNSLDDEEVLARLVALNAERIAEEASGQVRWLRPEYQISKAGLQTPVAQQGEIAVEVIPAVPAIKAVPWPKKLPDQIQAVRRLLSTGHTIEVKTAAKSFKGARKDRLEEVLQTLVAFGEARSLGQGRYAG